MRFISKDFKFPGMRKDQNFTIYPCSWMENNIKIQSSKRMGFVDLAKGEILLSKSCPNGAGFIMASEFMGAKRLPLTDAQVKELYEMRDDMGKISINGNSVMIVG